MAHYNTSSHFLWVGDRTRGLGGAHIEYVRGIRNPIGVKVGPSMQAEELVKLLESGSFHESLFELSPPMPIFIAVVNPNRESGRVTLITRYGAEKVYTDEVT
jgi:3-deoxy-7-phosphoheptulonate synthase